MPDRLGRTRSTLTRGSKRDEQLPCFFLLFLTPVTSTQIRETKELERGRDEGSLGFRGDTRGIDGVEGLSKCLSGKESDKCKGWRSVIYFLHCESGSPFLYSAVKGVGFLGVTFLKLSARSTVGRLCSDEYLKDWSGQ